MAKFDYPIRMCIICKDRFRQKNLFRYQIKDGGLASFSKEGRSFYMCLSCINGDEKRLLGVLNGRYKLNLPLKNCGKKLKEIATDG